MTAQVVSATAQVLDVRGVVAGAGFVVGPNLVATCAHVVLVAGGDRAEPVLLSFTGLPGAPQVRAHVLAEGWRDVQDADLALLRVDGLPAGVAALALGSAEGCSGHRVSSFGFPDQAPPEGHYGYAVAGDILPATTTRTARLQLGAANDLTTGFSGAPVVDEVTGVVIGMVTEICPPDRHLRGTSVAYATPVEVLRQVWPELAETAVCPYRGLETFAVEHAQWFHGRADAVDRVVAKLADARRVLLLGPSGAGKSSLIRAGLLPALAGGALPGSDRWVPVVARPGPDLAADLQRGGLPGAAEHGITGAIREWSARQPPGMRLLVVIDQFEELLARATDTDAVRQRDLIAELTTVVRAEPAVGVVLVLRDDFYPRLAALAPELLEALSTALLNTPATLSRRDLRDIVQRPAGSVGLRLQDGLCEQIITDVLAIDPNASSAQSAHVVVLPLLELTLQQLWERRHDGTLTHKAYRDVGGVAGSLTAWCDTTIGNLPGPQRLVAQRILTALVRPADPAYHIPAVRGQVSLAVLVDLAGDPAPGPRTSTHPDPGAAEKVLATLSAARIVTIRNPRVGGSSEPGADQPVAELVHDALIRDWPLLRDWIAQHHRFHDWLHGAEEQRTRWVVREHPDDLLHGSELADGLSWARERRLPHDVATFLAASRRRQQSRIHRARILTGVLVVLLMTAVAGAVVAFQQRQTAVTAQRMAVSRQLATQSSTMLATNPDLGSLLAIQAYHVSRTNEAVNSLYLAAALPIERRLTGNTSTVTAIAFDRADGNTAVTGASDGSVRLWETATGHEGARLGACTGAVNAVAFGRAGVLAYGCWDQTVRLWNPGSGTAATLRGHHGPVNAVAFDPAGRLLASGSNDGTVRLWDAASGGGLATLPARGGPVHSLSFSHDGRTLAAGGDDGAIRVWDVPGRRVLATLRASAGKVSAVAFSPTTNVLATASTATAAQDQAVKLWDVAGRRIQSVLYGRPGSARSLAFSPDGRTLATGGDDRTVQLWDVPTGSPRAVLAGHTGIVDAVAFSPDGRTLATGGDDSTLRLWDAAVGQPRAVLRGHTEAVTSVAFSPDGSTVATGSDDRTVRLWDVATGHPKGILLAGGDYAVTAVAFSPDGRTLASAGDDQTGYLWRLATGRIRARLIGHRNGVRAVAFSPDGHLIATGGEDQTVRLWDPDTGQLHATLLGHRGAVNAVAFDGDNTLASAGDDRTTRLWDVRTGAAGDVLGDGLHGVYGLAFSSRGALATANDEGRVQLWSVATRRATTQLNGHNNTVADVAFSPDGRTLATASWDETARLWDTATSVTRRVLTGHTGNVNAVAFSPDGHTVATASDDETARLWDVALPDPAAAVKRICTAVGRDLTSEERRTYLSGPEFVPSCA